jgi:transcriptional regulator with XRE-family HTH domain
MPTLAHHLAELLRAQAPDAHNQVRVTLVLPSRAVIAARLAIARARMGASPEQFAEMAGVDRSTYLDMERGGRSVSAETLANLAKSGLDLNYVLAGGFGMCCAGVAPPQQAASNQKDIPAPTQAA